MKTYLSDLIIGESQAIQLSSALNRQFEHEVGERFESIIMTISREEYVVRIHTDPKIAYDLYDRIRAFEFGFNAAYGIGGA